MFVEASLHPEKGGVFAAISGRRIIYQFLLEVVKCTHDYSI
jgi:hypothetical protein